MTTDEPMSTPDSGGLRDGLVATLRPLLGAHADVTANHLLSSAWMEGILAAHPKPAPSRHLDTDDATVGERECRCAPCPGRGNDGHAMTHCAECCWGTGVEAEYGCPIHNPATPPADDANRAPVSGGLDEGEREALRASIGSGRYAVTFEAVERILATRDAAWTERLAAVESERDEAERVGREWRATAFDLEDRAEAAEAERDTARREAGERIAVAIEALPGPDGVGLSRWTHSKAREGYLLAIEEAAGVARADALASDDGSGA